MSRLVIARVALGLLTLALVVLPGEVWGDASSDYEQRGLDPELARVVPLNRQLFDPFLVLQNGTWQACPCQPGSEVTISGQGLAASRATSATGVYELKGTEVFVDGRSALLHLVSPSQINFILPQETRPPVATLVVRENGEAWAEDTVAVGQREAVETAGVSVESEVVRLEPEAGEEPAIHLLTSPLSFRASFVVVVEEKGGSAVPLRVSFWNPRNFSSFDVVFSSEGHVQAEFLESRGRVASLTRIGDYTTGEAYDVTFEWRRSEEATASVAGEGVEGAVRLPAEAAPALFDAYRPSLTLLAAAHDGQSRAEIRDYHLELLPGRFTTLRIDDRAVPPLMGAISGVGLLLLLATVFPRRIRAGFAAVAGLPAYLLRKVKELPWPARVSLPAALLSYAGANAALFSLGSQPFDMGSQAAWSYIAAEYGITDLYYAAQTTTLAEVWNGVPYHEAVFPYNVGMSYYFWFIGEAHLLAFGHASPDSLSLAMTIKAFNLAFMLGDAVLVYAIIRHLKPGSSWLPWIGGGMLLLNPAFIFDTAVWGETESVVLFPLLASALAALKDRPGLAWSMLAVAFLSKQTVLLAVLVMGVYYLLKFPLRRNLESFSIAMVTVSVMILPFTLNGYPPSIAIDPTLAVLWIHGASGAEDVFHVVSYDAFNVWTLVTFLANGATGLGRFQQPDHSPVLGPLSYQHMGTILLGLSVVAILGWVLLNRRAVHQRPAALFLVLGLVFAVELFMPTRSLSRYFLLAVVFASAAVQGRSTWPAGLAVAFLTLTTLVGQWGSMALVLGDFPAHAPHLAPQNNPASELNVSLFGSDWFITTAAALNALSLPLLAAAAWLSLRPARTDRVSSEAVEQSALGYALSWHPLPENAPSCVTKPARPASNIYEY